MRRGDGIAAALAMRPSKPVVPQGEAGLSAKGPGQASHYYSLPRLRTTGTVQIDGERHLVSGLGWLDREWSTSALSPGQIGWAWFALMLDNGDDIMAFQLRREDGARDPYDHGAWIDPTGSKRTLTPADFRLTPTHHWRDDQGTRWPTSWQLDLGERHFTITAALNDQRMDTLFTYWEGLVRVSDANGQDPRPRLHGTDRVLRPARRRCRWGRPSGQLARLGPGGHSDIRSDSSVNSPPRDLGKCSASAGDIRPLNAKRGVLCHYGFGAAKRRRPLWWVIDLWRAVDRWELKQTSCKLAMRR